MGSKRLTPTSGKNGLKMFVVVVVDSLSTHDRLFTQPTCHFGSHSYQSLSNFKMSNCSNSVYI